FLIFRMRGLSREGFLALLGGQAEKDMSAAASLPREPLPADPPAFWNSPADLPAPSPPDDRITEAALPRRLGKFPFWRGSLRFYDFFDDAYRRASAHASALLSPDE